jgi:hypothetical protein
VFTAIECDSNALRLRMPSSNNVETMSVQQQLPPTHPGAALPVVALDFADIAQISLHQVPPIFRDYVVETLREVRGWFRIRVVTNTAQKFKEIGDGLQWKSQSRIPKCFASLVRQSITCPPSFVGLKCFTPSLFIKIGFLIKKCGASGMAAIMIVCRGTTFTIQWDQELWLAVVP